MDRVSDRSTLLHPGTTPAADAPAGDVHSNRLRWSSSSRATWPVSAAWARPARSTAAAGGAASAPPGATTGSAGRPGADERAAKLIAVDDATPGRHALLVLTDDASCAFLDHGLCSIQARFGEELLPDACASFPPSLGRVGDRFERVATTACPEI